MLAILGLVARTALRIQDFGGRFIIRPFSGREYLQDFEHHEANFWVNTRKNLTFQTWTSSISA